MKHQEIAVKNLDMKNEKLFNFRPVFFTAIFLCLGILFAYARLFYQVSAWWLLCGAPLLIVPFFLYHGRQRRLQAFLAIFTLIFAFGLGNVIFQRQITNYAQATVCEGTHHVVGTVVEMTEYEYSVKVVLNDLQIDKNKEKGKLVAYLPLSFAENVSISDELLLQAGPITDKEIFNEYGFRAYDIGANIRWETKNVEDCVIIGQSSNLFLRIRLRIEQRLFQGMENSAASVTLAVLTGDTAQMEDGLLENVRMGGIAHIFAVSGLHVGALYGFCLWLIEKTRLRVITKPIRFLLVASLLVFYAGICGFSSSIMRAMTLCLVSYAAKLIGTDSDMLQSTGLAAIFILLLNPTELFAIGFQLSFVACLGIALFARPIRFVIESGAGKIKIALIKLFRLQERARPNPKRKGEASPPSIAERIWATAVSFTSVSLAAQIATAPLLLHAFGYLSLWGLLLNGIFVPFISGIFSVLLLFVGVACLLPSAITVILLYIPSIVWSAVLLLFEGIDFSSFALYNIHISIGSAISYYGGFIFLTDKWNMSKYFKKVFAVVFFLTFVITMYALNA